MPELIFSIDKTTSETTNTLTVSIFEAEKIANDFKTLPKQRILTVNLLKKLSLPKEQMAITFLIREELLYAKKKLSKIDENNTPLNSIHIPFSSALEGLQLVAATGKLHFNDKQLICDFYGKTEFYYQVQSENTKNVVTGHLKLRDKDIDVRDCTFICGGSPLFFIHGIVLKTIGTDISWLDLKKFYYESPIPAEKLDLEISDQEPNTPKIIYIGNSKELQQHNDDPSPVLMLKDRFGAFADLFMDYGNNIILPFQENYEHSKTKRQSTSEKGWEKDLLETGFIKKNVQNSHYFCSLDKIAKSLAFLLEIGWKIVDFKGNTVVNQTSTELSLENQETNILIRGKILYENFNADLTDVTGAFNRRERFVQLSSNTVGLIPQSWENTPLNGWIDDCEVVQEGIKIPKNNFGSLASLMNSNVKLDATLINLKERISSFSNVEKNYPPGIRFSGELRPYQQEGVNWLSFLYDFGFHGILADDMGLGKTVQVLAFLSRIQFDAPVIVVVPTSLIFNWKKEIEKFLPHVEIIIHHGGDRVNLEDVAKHKIIITSYTILRMDIDNFSKLYFQCVILDEAQVIKNSQTQIAKAIFRLQTKFRLSITGTPIENNLKELWSHFRFLIPDLLGDEQSFDSELLASASDSRYLQRIKKKIRPFILRRRKEEVAKDLPEKIEQIVWVQMSLSQRTVYDTFLAGVKSTLIKKVQVDGAKKHRMEILEAILRLRQICCHPLLVSSLNDDQMELTSSKMEALLDDLETIIKEERKVLVYSQFTTMLHLMTQAAKKRAWNYTYLDGSTKNREQVVAQFQDNPQTSIFFISLKAGGIGLNLTAADYVFLYDPWWNDAVENQAISRAHRIGRKNTVIAKRYLVTESIEEKIMKLKASKRHLVDTILDDELSNLHLDEEDFLYLLS